MAVREEAVKSFPATACEGIMEPCDSAAEREAVIEQLALKGDIL